MADSRVASIRGQSSVDRPAVIGDHPAKRRGEKPADRRRYGDGTKAEPTIRISDCDLPKHALHVRDHWA
jgi:hypothetical protein